MLNHDLEYFKLTEFKHPELINAKAAYWLNEFRGEYGHPIRITDDARVAGDRPPGSSANSWHFKGQAFDFRTRHLAAEGIWELDAAVHRLAARLEAHDVALEWEIVAGRNDKHGHIAFIFDNRPHRMIIAAD